MEQKFKKAIIDSAKDLIKAVQADDFEKIAKAMQFLNFACQTVSGVNALAIHLQAKKEVKNGEEKTA